MAVLDAALELSAEQAITVSAASTNVIEELETTGPPDSGAKPWVLKLSVDETFADGTSLTVNVAQDTALPIDGSSVVKVTTGAIPVADLVKGYTREIEFFADDLTAKYWGVYYTASGTFTAGKISAYVTGRSS